MAETHTTSAASASPGFFAIWTRLPLTMLTGLVAVIYGVGFALGWHESMGWWMPVGAALVALLFAGSLVQAMMKSRSASA